VPDNPDVPKSADIPDNTHVLHADLSRRNRLTAAVAALLVGAALVTGCSGDDDALPIPSGEVTTTTNPNVYEQNRAEGVSALLDDLSAALTAGDSAALARLIDPSATTVFRTRLETAAANFGAPAPRPTSSSRTPEPRTTEPRTTPPQTTTRSRGTGAPSTSGGSAAPEPVRTSAPVTTPGPSTTAPLPDDSRGSALRPATLRYQLVLSDEAETQAPEAVTDKLTDQGSSDVWVAPVDLHYALGGARAPGIDEPELVSSEQLVVARYDDSWKVVGDATLVGGSAPPTMLWELAGLRVDDVPTSGGTSVIASYQGTADTVERVRGLLPAAVFAVQSFWGTDWPRKAVIVVTRTPRQFTTVSGAPEADGAAAAATVFAGIDADGTVRGQRVVLTPNAQRIPAPALGVVLRHELSHVATRSITSTKAPLWVTEGFAEYVGRKQTYRRIADAAPDLAAEVRSGSVPRTLPVDADFAVSGLRAGVAYQTAWSLWAFVAGRFGEGTLKKLYRTAAAGDASASTGAIASVLKIDPGDFVAQWRRWLVAETR